MASLSLKVKVNNLVKTMKFDPSTIVYDACRIIREKVSEAASLGNPNDFGLFLSDEDSRKGCWLEAGRALDYYLLRNGDLLEYRHKQRILRVRMLDETVKTLQVDDSHTVAQLMITICSRIGISNHEEYSLLLEMSDDELEKTLTLKRDKSIAKDQKKLDEMKKRLHTDDDLNWLDHSKTLREQGVTNEKTLLLRRKFFFADQNIDGRDPVQLNLLYVQLRDAILDGAHPVSLDEAVEFAGLQAQIQFGDFNEQKHRSGLFDSREFLPKEYTKTKGWEKKIFAEHRQLAGRNEIEAKVQYTQKARALKTYGITFFLVKEKMKGKNKLVPTLFGVTKESVVRVDAKTKEIKDNYPLTTVRRWAASPNSFTLDFGDYADQYYSVQTIEGEKIAQLIAGYIDIILKKKKAKDHLGIDGEEESAMYEDQVAPARATIIQQQSTKVGQGRYGSVAVPGVLRDANSGAHTPLGSGSLQRAQLPVQLQHALTTPGQSTLTRGGLSQAQRALLGTLDDANRAVKAVQVDLEDGTRLPELGTDPASLQWRREQEDLSKQNVGAQLSAMNAATAQVVTLTSAEPDETDYGAVGSAIAAISSNIGEFSKDVKLLAALQDDNDGDRLIDAARRLAGAFSDMLTAAQPGNQEFLNSEFNFPRQNLLSAASRIGEASNDLMRKVGEDEDELDRSFQDMLLNLAKAVANATATLVLKAKGVASACDDQADQNRVISSATQCALSTSQLVACTKVVAPTIVNPNCQEQLVEAAKVVSQSVDEVVDSAEVAGKDENSLGDLRVAASAVSKALNEMLLHIKRGASGDRQGQQTVDTILTATDRLFSSAGDTAEMVQQARILAHATSQLVNAIKTQAEAHTDTHAQQKLLAAARQLADATARMVEAAKGCASDPHGSQRHQKALRQAAQDLRSATSTAAGSALKRKVIKRLEAAAKNAACSATQLINASGGATRYNRNVTTQTQLMQQCKLVADNVIPKLVQGIKATLEDGESAGAQLSLISAAQDTLHPATQLATDANAAAPTVSDQSCSMALNHAARNMSAALAELRAATSRAQEAVGTLELDGALDQVHKLERQLNEIGQNAAANQLKPLPGETAESSAAQVGATSKTVGSSMAQLLTAAAQGNENYTGIAARDTANILRVLTNAVRGVVATSNDRALQGTIVGCARDVMEKSADLISEARNAVSNPSDGDNQTRLAQVAKAVSQALNSCVNCLPGLREVDSAVKHITTISQKLSNPVLPESKRSYQEVQIHLSNNAVSLNQAASDVVSASRGSPQSIAHSSNRFSHAYEDFVDSGLEMAGVSKETETQTQIVSSLKTVSTMSSKLLISAKSLLADPTAPNSKNLLSSAARGVTDSINSMINVCTTAAPGQKECDNALRQMTMMRNLLENPTEPISDATYFDCLEGAMEKTSALAQAMTGMSNLAKQQEIGPFCDNVRNFAAAVCALAEHDAQAAYLVGIADSNSEPGRSGLVDQSQFSRANQAIQMACQNLANPSSTQQQVLSAATIIAKHTSSLCNSCRSASAKTTNPVAKRHFVQSAKDVANSTASLVTAIKALDSDFTDENRRRCSQAARPLVSAVDELTTYASSPEFTSVPAKISGEARLAQEPLVAAGVQLLDGACNMVGAAKQLAVKPKDPPTYQQYSKYSKQVSASVKNLLTSIRDNAPGQKECDMAIARLKTSTKEVEDAKMAALSQSLSPRNTNSIRGFQEQLVASVRELLDRIDLVRTASKGEAEKLGHFMATTSTFFEPLAASAIGLASKTMNSKRQMAVLEQTLSVCEAALQMSRACKEGGGNPKALNAHHVIDESCDSTTECLRELLATLDESASAEGIVSSMVDGITKSMSSLSNRHSMIAPTASSFVEHQTKLVHAVRQLSRLAQEMAGKAGSSATELGPMAGNLTRLFEQLAAESRGAAASNADADFGTRLSGAVHELGRGCVALVQSAGSVQSTPQDSLAKKELVERSGNVLSQANGVLTCLQHGARGTQACINAASTVSGIIGDLDTTVMFATAGSLNPEHEECFADHRENILQTAKSLVEDTKVLVAGAASNQEELAKAAQSAVMTITRLSECVKQGAASLGSEQPEAQVLLINAVKDVATALGELISATKTASGSGGGDSRAGGKSMETLKYPAKVMVNNVTSLLKTVKTVEDEAARGTRALESTIEAIGQELRNYVSTEHVETKISAEELIRSTKPITIATAKAVAAGNSCRQEDVIVAANMGRKAIFDLLMACKGAAATSDSYDTKKRALEAGKMSVLAYKELLEQVNNIINRPTTDNKQRLAFISKKVANAVTELVSSAEAIKGQEWVDPNDPTIIAESELLSAANSIEMASRKLATLRPRQSLHVKEVDESLQFEEQILEAAKSIAAATAALVKAASAAQQELVAQGRIGQSPTQEEDSQWSHGLVSAAKTVAVATHSLCDAANSMVQGQASEERLISSAKQVASSTAQLLVACQVKADPDSLAMKRLQAAGNAVNRATQALVRSAQEILYQNEDQELTINQRMVGGMAQILDAQEEILVKEKELESARKRLEIIRKAKYKESDAEDSTGSAF